MKRMRLGALLLLSVFSLLRCQPNNEGGSRIGGSEQEQVQLSKISVSLPPSPSFQKEHAPERYTDSSYSVYGLRKNIKDTIDKQVRVKGFIIEVYECPPCPKGTTCPACNKPHLFLGDRANSSKEDALLVADFPLEDPKTKKKLTFDTGMQYFVTGVFSKTSGTGFSSSDGLLVYSEAKKASED
jgi:hypothetical protein